MTKIYKVSIQRLREIVEAYKYIGEESMKYMKIYKINEPDIYIEVGEK